MTRAMTLSGSQLATYDASKRWFLANGYFDEDAPPLHFTSSFVQRRRRANRHATRRHAQDARHVTDDDDERRTARCHHHRSRHHRYTRRTRSIPRFFRRRRASGSRHGYSDAPRRGVAQMSRIGVFLIQRRARARFRALSLSFVSLALFRSRRPTDASSRAPKIGLFGVGGAKNQCVVTLRLDDVLIASRRVVGGGGVRGVASSRETVVDRASRFVVRRCVSRRRRRVENVIENIQNIRNVCRPLRRRRG